MKLARHWWVIIGGLLTLWLIRYLPPDTSLMLVRQDGVITVCHPATLPPYVSEGRNDSVDGIEVRVVEQVAAELGVRVQWNVQRDWYRTLDPTAWGIRKEACDLLAGGIAATDSSRGILVLSEPYLQTGWRWVGRELPQRRDEVGFWAPYLGLEQLRFDATDYLDDQRLYPYFVRDPYEARDLLANGDLNAVLTDGVTARWLAEQTGLQTWNVPELPRYRVALGMWKGSVTLNRAVNRALDDIATAEQTAASTTP